MAKKHQHRKNKREQYKNDFFGREQQINKLIKIFIKKQKTLQYPPTVDEYEYMDKLRLEIKRLFDLQSDTLWKQSYRRKRFYNKQLTKFKYHYTKWKRYTYYIYLYLRFDMPLHLIQSLRFYKNISHDILFAIYSM